MRGIYLGFLLSIAIISHANAGADAFSVQTCGTGTGSPGDTRQQTMDLFGAMCVDNVPWSSKFINTATTTVVKSGSGIIGSIISGKPISLSVITAYDNTAGSGTVILKLTNPTVVISQQVVIPLNIAFANGLTIVTTGTDDFTVTYK